MTSITCIIPAYNAERYILEALDSVFAQTLRVDQIIVVNDGSTDRTDEILRTLGSRIEYYAKEHSGICPTLNRGLAAAKGEMLTFLDSDDIWTSDKTQIQYDYLIAHPEIDACFGHTQEFLSPDIPAEQLAGLYARPEPLAGIHKVCAMIRRDFFEKVGPYDEAARGADFIDWYARAKEAGIRQYVHPDIFAHRRVHLHNYTRVKREELHGYMKVLKSALDRKRSNENFSNTLNT
jgi:glycosyltransferase involved in cell wall biosynthesis